MAKKQTEGQKIVEFNGMISHYKQELDGYGHYEKPTFEGNIIKWLDTTLRMAIGKTDDIRIALCSHQAIINREFPNYFCRVCNTDLSIEGKGRFNDFLILRHPQCTKPICSKCAKENPDAFHIAFREGLKKVEKLRAELNLEVSIPPNPKGQVPEGIGYP